MLTSVGAALQSVDNEWGLCRHSGQDAGLTSDVVAGLLKRSTVIWSTQFLSLKISTGKARQNISIPSTTAPPVSHMKTSSPTASIHQALHNSPASVQSRHIDNWRASAAMHSIAW